MPTCDSHSSSLDQVLKWRQLCSHSRHLVLAIISSVWGTTWWVEDVGIASHSIMHKTATPPSTTENYLDQNVKKPWFRTKILGSVVGAGKISQEPSQEPSLTSFSPGLVHSRDRFECLLGLGPHYRGLRQSGFLKPLCFQRGQGAGWW